MPMLRNEPTKILLELDIDMCLGLFFLLNKITFASNMNVFFHECRIASFITYC